jgi:predicted RNA methylase
MFQQYSTPAPISFIASLYVSQTNNLGSVKRGGRFTKNHFSITNNKQQRTNEQQTTNNKLPLFFEPSAGNGLLTIALPYEQTIVNELDDVRLENLKSQPFKKVMNQDATMPFIDFYKHFNGIVTNPPFGSLMEEVKYDGFPIKKLDFLMSLRALDTMKDGGKCAIIVGGHTEFDDVGRVQAGQNRIFYNYLYSHYNIEDIINIDGHKLYSRQGTAFNVRLILINGRKDKVEGVAPLKNELLSEVVSDFDRLWQRVYGLSKNDKTDNVLQTAYNLGVEAFKKGKIRVAMQDAELMQLIEGKVGTNAEKLEQWIKGWDYANLNSETKAPETDADRRRRKLKLMLMLEL